MEASLHLNNVNNDRSPTSLILIIKRLMDITLAILLTLLLLPVLALIILLVELTSRGPILYYWKVVGREGRFFTSYKFRTMVVNADKLKKKLLVQNQMSGPVFKMKQDPRITPLGRFLRKYSLDELPQLWSVIKGDMSLVGPRPPLQTEYLEYEEWQKRKLSVTPGMTCLWQVNGRNEIRNFNDWVKMDLEYIDNWSLGLDIKILLQTILAVFRGSGV